MSPTQWYYVRDKKQQGPVTLEELQQLATSGELRPTDTVWNEEMPNWEPARTVPGLFDAGTGPVAGKETALRGRLRDYGSQAMGFRARLAEMADLPTWLFGVGSFLIIGFLFMPAVDQSKIEGREAAIEAGQANEDRSQREFTQKEKKDAKDEEIRKKGKEAWDREKQELQEDVVLAKAAAKRWHYWYTWGMLIGFLLLAGASLAYVQPSQPATRRILGTIVLAGEILFIFSKYVGGAGLFKALIG